MLSDTDSGAGSRTTAQGQMILPVCSIFRRFLKRQGLKFTTERATILDAVLRRQAVFEAEELVEELRHAEHAVSKATVYRTLKHLREAGIISEVLLDSRQAHYQLSIGHKPSGHLVCGETGRVINFPIDQLNKLARRVCAEHGFEHVSHRFVVYGVGGRRDEGTEGRRDGGGMANPSA